MDAFEQIIGQLLEEEKYWIRHSVKIELSKKEKQDIGTPCTPRPEIDIVALDQSSNAIYLLEVKSFLDSSGVVFEQVTDNQDQQKGRYKLLTSDNYRKVISARLLEDWIKIGIITKDTKINFGLIAGKVHSDKKNPNRETDLKNYFANKNWLFWGPTEIKDKIRKLAAKGYENNAVTIATKILTR
jgi:hypothetical protein